MISIIDVHTICAALRFWEEEMCPHDASASSAYFEPGQEVAMSSPQIRRLRHRLVMAELRFTVASPQTDQLQSLALFDDANDARSQCLSQEDVIATILIPERESQTSI